MEYFDLQPEKENPELKILSGNMSIAFEKLYRELLCQAMLRGSCYLLLKDHKLHLF